MELLKIFIIVAIETSAFVLLCNIFLDKGNVGNIKRGLIILTTILIFTATKSLNHVLMIAIDYAAALLGVKLAYKKPFKESFIALFFVLSVGLTIEMFIVVFLSVIQMRIFEKVTFIHSIIYYSIFVMLSFFICNYKYRSFHKTFMKYKDELYGRYFLFFF